MADLTADLELATNQELIDELLRRSTFGGVIIWNPDQVKGQCGAVTIMPMQVAWRNCDKRGAVTNLHTAINLVLATPE